MKWRFKTFSFRGVRFRLALSFLIIFGLSLVATSVYMYRSLATNHEREFDQALHNFSVDLRHSLEIDFFGRIAVGRQFSLENEKILPFHLGDTLVQIRDATGRSVAKSGTLLDTSLPMAEEDRRRSQSEGESFRTIQIHNAVRNRLERYRLLTVFLDQSRRARPTNFFVQIAAPYRSVDSEARSMFWVFALAIPVILSIALFVGLYLSTRMLRPIRAIIENTRKIGANELDKRLPEPPVRDELFELTETLNGLLNRLQRSFESQDHFIAHVSHQLRTPLTVARCELELLEARLGHLPEHATSLRGAINELGYLGRLIEHLLMLARMEAGAGTLTLRKVRLDEVALEVVSSLNNVAKKRDIKIQLNVNVDELSDCCLELDGDGDLLRSMIENLVDNAVKYSPEGGTVTLELLEDPLWIRVIVRDQGIGIRKDQQANIFQRFYRADQTPSARASGSGLGLTVVAEIARIHGGTVEVHSDGVRGSQFVVTLPRPIQPAAALAAPGLRQRLRGVLTSPQQKGIG